MTITIQRRAGKGFRVWHDAFGPTSAAETRVYKSWLSLCRAYNLTPTPAPDLRANDDGVLPTLTISNIRADE